MENLRFTEDLIKGKIAETVFEQMFRASKKFIVHQFGYEHTLPELAQYQHLVEIQDVLKNIRNAPDFVLVTNDRKGVYLVEVKYRHERKDEEVRTIAEHILGTWNPSWLFVASPDGFFFSPCSSIVKQDGKIAPLAASWIPREEQKRYLALLDKYEQEGVNQAPGTQAR